MKDVEIPQATQRAMAREAEALREKRARIIKAEAELESSKKLAEAADNIAAHPAALELRRMQMIAEVGAEQHTTTILMMPSEFVTLARDAATFFCGPGPVAQPAPAPAQAARPVAVTIDPELSIHSTWTASSPFA